MPQYPRLYDSAGLACRVSERVVLAGLMKYPAEVRGVAVDTRLDRGHFYFDTNQRLFDVQMWLAHGNRLCGPSEVLRELTRRSRAGGSGGVHWLGLDSLDASEFLADVWATESHLPDIHQWADTSQVWMLPVSQWCFHPYPKIELEVWAAHAAALKIIHLASRRAMIHAANELVRDALSPTGGADELDKRVGDTYGEEY